MIETADDEDWFRLETSERLHLKVRMTGGLDTVGVVYDESLWRLATDDGGSGASFTVWAEVPADVLYERVRAHSGSDTGGYTMEEH